MDFLVCTKSDHERNVQEFMKCDLLLADDVQLRPSTGQMAQLGHVAALWFHLSHLRVQLLAATGYSNDHLRVNETEQGNGSQNFFVPPFDTVNPVQ